MPFFEERPYVKTPPALPEAKTCFLIACKNGAGTLATTVSAAVKQAPVYVVSDGSDDETVDVAVEAGASVMVLDNNIGKPNALREAFDYFHIRKHYDYVVILDDDTRIEDYFLNYALAEAKDDVVAVCGRVASEKLPETKWNWLVNGRALAYWRYGWSDKITQNSLNSITVISGSNVLFDTATFNVLVHHPIDIIVDDTQWVLEIQTNKVMGRVGYAYDAVGYIQDPTNVRDYYRQMLRWMWGTFQGIRKFQVAKQRTWFSRVYLVLMLDWLIYAVLWPMLAIYIGYRAIDSGDYRFVGFYLVGYVLWAALGALGTRRWPMVFMPFAFFVFDQLQRVIFIHALFKAWREPRSPCIWKSPTRVERR